MIIQLSQFLRLASYEWMGLTRVYVHWSSCVCHWEISPKGWNIWPLKFLALAQIGFYLGWMNVRTSEMSHYQLTWSHSLVDLRGSGSLDDSITRHHFSTENGQRVSYERPVHCRLTPHSGSIVLHRSDRRDSDAGKMWGIQSEDCVTNERNTLLISCVCGSRLDMSFVLRLEFLEFQKVKEQGQMDMVMKLKNVLKAVGQSWELKRWAKKSFETWFGLSANCNFQSHQQKHLFQLVVRNKIQAARHSCVCLGKGSQFSF